jgi:hypothetical protein
MKMQDLCRHGIVVLLVSLATLGVVIPQGEEEAEASPGDADVECDAFTLEGIAPGMKYKQVENLLRARKPKPRSARTQRNYIAGSGWQVVHRWHVADGTLEVWYEGQVTNRKKNPAAVRVRLLLPAGSATPEALWQSVFDRFGPMSKWEREDCDIKAAVGLEKDQPHTTLSLLSWERASELGDD